MASTPLPVYDAESTGAHPSLSSKMLSGRKPGRNSLLSKPAGQTCGTETGTQFVVIETGRADLRGRPPRPPQIRACASRTHPAGQLTTSLRRAPSRGSLGAGKTVTLLQPRSPNCCCPVDQRPAANHHSPCSTRRAFATSPMVAPETFPHGALPSRSLLMVRSWSQRTTLGVLSPPSGGSIRM